MAATTARRYLKPTVLPWAAHDPIVNEDLATFGFDQTIHNPEKCRLTTAACANEGNKFSGCNRKIDAAQNFNRGIALLKHLANSTGFQLFHPGRRTFHHLCGG